MVDFSSSSSSSKRRERRTRSCENLFLLAHMADIQKPSHVPIGHHGHTSQPTNQPTQLEIRLMQLEMERIKRENEELKRQIELLTSNKDSNKTQESNNSTIIPLQIIQQRYFIHFISVFRNWRFNKFFGESEMRLYIMTF